MPQATDRYVYTSASFVLPECCDSAEIFESIRAFLGEVADRLGVVDNILHRSEAIQTEDGLRVRLSVRGNSRIMAVTIRAVADQYPECFPEDSRAELVEHSTQALLPSDVWPGEELERELKEAGYFRYSYITPVPEYLPHSLATNIVRDSINRILIRAEIDPTDEIKGWDTNDLSGGMIEVGCWCTPISQVVLDADLEEMVHSRLSGVLLNQDITEWFISIIGDRGFES